MTRILLLATSLWGQSISTAPAGNYQSSRLDAIELLLRDYTVGRSTFTGLPTFQNGIKFNDGTTQTTAAAILTSTQTFSGQNTFSSTVIISSAVNFTGSGSGLNAATSASYSNGPVHWVWAKSVSSVTDSSGCFVLMAMNSLTSSTDNTTPGVLVFTSTTTGSASGQPGVLMESCAAGNICRVAVWGPVRVQARTTSTRYNSLDSFTTRCQAENATLGNSNGGVWITDESANWAWAFMGGH